MRRPLPPPLDTSRRALVERAAFTVSMADRAGWPAAPEVVRRALAPLLDDDELAAIDAVEPGDLDPVWGEGWASLCDRPGPRPTAEEIAEADRAILEAVRATA